MFVIVAEGIDKAGKRSQIDKLYEALLNKGYHVIKSGFHQYETPTGQLIRKYLDGEYQVNKYAIELIMAADKYAQLDWFRELKEQEVDVLLLDRYVLSQIIYSYALEVDPDFVFNLLQFLPEPDFHIYLDLDPEESMKRMGEHGENDKYESDKMLLTKVREAYLSVMTPLQEESAGMILDATLSIDELHQQILERVLTLLPQKEVVEV